jgi:hypothetical protein
MPAWNSFQEFLEALVQYGVCSINKISNYRATVQEGIKVGFGFIAIAAMHRSSWAMVTLPRLHEAFNFPFPKTKFAEMKESGEPVLGSDDPCFGISTCIATGYHTGSLIALEAPFGAIVEEKCLTHLQENPR